MKYAALFSVVPLTPEPRLLALFKYFECAVAYTMLARVFIASEGPTSELAVAFDRDFKGKISLVIYLVAIPLSLVSNWLALALYGLVAAIWFIPDSHIEKRAMQ